MGEGRSPDLAILKMFRSAKIKGIIGLVSFSLLMYQQLVAQIEQLIDRPNKSPEEIRNIVHNIKERLRDLQAQFTPDDFDRAVAELSATCDRANKLVEKFHSQVYRYGLTIAALVGVAMTSTVGFKVCCGLAFILFAIWYTHQSQHIYDRQSLASDRFTALKIVARDYRVARIYGEKQGAGALV